MDFLIVAGKTPAELVEVVNGWCKKGWEPIGGMTIQHVGFEDIYYHSIIYRG